MLPNPKGRSRMNLTRERYQQEIFDNRAQKAKDRMYGSTVGAKLTDAREAHTGQRQRTNKERRRKRKRESHGRSQN